MTKLQLLIIGIIAVFFFSSCVQLSPIAPPLPSAYLYGDTKANLNCTSDGENGCTAGIDGKPVGTKTGEACAVAVFGIIQLGDMSLKTAAAKGGISNVTSVDYSIMNIFGPLFLKKCLIVNGN